MMRIYLLMLLLGLPLLVSGDARFVEAPAECHFPYDNADVNNEFKLQGCAGTLKARGGGATYDAHVVVQKDNLPGNAYVINGEDVRDVEAYPGGQLTITTTGAESGTDCNIVNQDVNYATGHWESNLRVYRTQNQFRVDVEYDLSCTGAQ